MARDQTAFRHDSASPSRWRTKTHLTMRTVTVLSVGVLIRRGYEHFRRREVKKTVHSATTVDARDATKGVLPTYVGGPDTLPWARNSLGGLRDMRRGVRAIFCDLPGEEDA